MQGNARTWSGRRGVRALTALLLALLLYVNLGSTLVVRADSNGRVTGTVADGTTDDLLKLATDQGAMLIKMDSDLKISGGGVLLPGAKVTVDWKYGNDSYLHTSAITAPAGTVWGAVVDTANTITVTGKILAGSDQSHLLLEYSGSQFHVRLDSFTLYENCRILQKDKLVDITVARGSDAYLHAVKISRAATTVVTSTISGVPDKTDDGRTISTFSGEVLEGTTDGVLKIKVNGNAFLVKITKETDVTQIHALIPGKTIQLAVYRGSDRNLYAYKLAGEITASGATLDGGTANVTGTVHKDTTDNVLYLDTTSGRMTIRLDPTTDIGTTGLLFIGKKVSVTVQRGSDAYLHAVKIWSDNASSSSTATRTSTQISSTAERTSEEHSASGTVDGSTTNAVLYLNTTSGRMTIRLDANTQFPACGAMKVGQTVTVKYYRGSDAYNHAASVVSNIEGAPATTLNGASVLEFSGSITKIDGYKITLKTADNELVFRFDNSTDFTYFRILKTGVQATITGMTGVDGSWHATKVVGE